MGSGASAGLTAAVKTASKEELGDALKGLPAEDVKKIQVALSAEEPAKQPTGGSPPTTSSELKAPPDVLHFWYGGAWGTDEMDNLESLNRKMWSFWMAATEDDDARCKVFVDTIRALGRGELVGGHWETNAGTMAKLILADQLSRNCFRGTKEVFQYDEIGFGIVRQLFQSGEFKNFQQGCYLWFLSSLVHSEVVEDQEIADRIMQYMKDANISLPEAVEKGARSHKAVIDRFGRFPHRNWILGRESTPEEEAWLADYDNLPFWAKSQLPKK